jgi:ribonuclease BN (tRNA processing enzyme)
MSDQSLEIRFVGCGDAFGSGGRFNTCFHVKGTRHPFLIDCGATSLVALKQQYIDLNAIQTILVTHFHADHFGGVPFLIIDANFSKRQTPLTIAGPPGLKSKFVQFMEFSFPGASTSSLNFPLNLIELPPNVTSAIDDISITPIVVDHGPQVGTCFAYRIEAFHKVLAYSSDTQWTDALIEIGKGADLLICEAYFRTLKVKWHLDLATLQAQLHNIRPKRLILTHMSNDMLAHASSIEFECARDGLVISL